MRRPASWRMTAWWMTDSMTGAAKRLSARSTLPPSLPSALRIVVCGIVLLRLLHDEQAVARPGHRTLDQDEVALRVDLHDRELLDGHPLVAHVTGHAGALPDAAGVGPRADRAGRPMMVGAVRLRPALEVVAGDDAGEAVALADPGHVNELSGLEQADLQLLADLVAVGRVEAHLADVLRVLEVLVEVLELTRDRLRSEEHTSELQSLA